jgi:hypothetical protein
MKIMFVGGKDQRFVNQCCASVSSPISHLVATWERYFGPKFRLTSAAMECVCGWGRGPQEILAIHLVSSGAHTWSAPKACLFVCYWLEL